MDAHLDVAVPTIALWQIRFAARIVDGWICRTRQVGRPRS